MNPHPRNHVPSSRRRRRFAFGQFARTYVVLTVALGHDSLATFATVNWSIWRRSGAFICRKQHPQLRHNAEKVQGQMANDRRGSGTFYELTNRRDNNDRKELSQANITICTVRCAKLRLLLILICPKTVLIFASITAFLIFKYL